MTDPRRELQERLASAGWLAWPRTRAVFAALTADGAAARAVGGAVRDTLLGRPVREIDIAIDAPPETVMELARRAGIKAVPTGLDHGTVTLVAGDKAFEVTTLRADIESYGRHARVEYTGDWEGDARRRDFTINALYAGADGALFDPLGGLDDVMARRVRFIGEARERIREDYLRILRYFRFVSELEPETLDREALDACVRERAGLRQLAAERIQHEFVRLLRGPGAAAALRAMFDYGLLVDVLGGAPRLARFERLAAIEAALGRTPAAMARLAALAVAVPEDVERLADRLRLSNAQAAALGAGLPLRGLSAGMDEDRAKAALYRTGGKGWEDRVLTAWAASGDSAADAGWRSLLDLPARWPVPEFPVGGEDIVRLGVPPGPRVGAILKRIESDWVEAGFATGRDELIRRAERLLDATHDMDGGTAE